MIVYYDFLKESKETFSKKYPQKYLKEKVNELSTIRAKFLSVMKGNPNMDKQEKNEKIKYYTSLALQHEQEIIDIVDSYTK